MMPSRLCAQGSASLFAWNLSLFLGMLRLAHGLTGRRIADFFRENLSTDSAVYLPTDDNYANETTQRWDIYAPPTYVVSVKPTCESDVQTIISYSQNNSIPFLGTGGGHGYSTSLGALQNGIELDLGFFSDVAVDASNNTLTIGGSALGSQVLPALQTAGKEIPTGACSCIGMVGATLGGGIGYYSSLYGTLSDSLVSVRMVTGTGEALTVSTDSNPDLFWGVRGAGFNYGIVTEATYRVYDFTNGGIAMSADMMFSIDRNRDVWEVVKGYVGHQPKELSLNVAVGANPMAPSALTIIVNALYVGPNSTFQDLIQPFLALSPTNLNISALSFGEVNDNAIYGLVTKGCIKGALYTSWGINIYDVDVPTLVDVVNTMNATIPNDPKLGFSQLAYTQLAQEGFQRHPPYSSAFPYRDTVAFTRVDATYLDPSDADVVNTFADSLRSKLQTTAGGPDGELQVYVHYAEGNEDPGAWYTEENLPRLQELKARYDPANLFGFYNAVPSR